MGYRAFRLPQICIGVGMWEHANKQECEKNEKSTLSECAQVDVLYCVTVACSSPYAPVARWPLPATADEPGVCVKCRTLPTQLHEIAFCATG